MDRLADDVLRLVAAFCESRDRAQFGTTARRLRAATPPASLCFHAQLPPPPLPPSAAERWQHATHLRLTAAAVDVVELLRVTCPAVTTVTILVTRQGTERVLRAWGPTLTDLNGNVAWIPALVEALPCCPALTTLRIPGTIVVTAALPNLTTLEIKKLGQPMPELVGRLTSLTQLTVHGGADPPLAVALAAACPPGLTALRLVAPGAAAALERIARRCPGLTELCASTDGAKAAIAAGVPALRTLTVAGGTQDLLLSTILDALPQRAPLLASLKLSGIPPDARIGAPWPQLRRLVLGSFSREAEAWARAHLRKDGQLELRVGLGEPLPQGGPLPQLRAVHSELCPPGFPDMLLRSGGAGHWPQLRELRVHDPGLFDEDFTEPEDELVEALARGCPRLRELELNGRRLTDRSLRALALHCRDLEVLELESCTVSAAGVAALVAGCRLLRHFPLKHCRGVTHEEAAALLRQCPRIAERDIADLCPPAAVKP